jgi:FdhE protein
MNKRAEGLKARKNISDEYLGLFCALYAEEYKAEQKLRLRDLYPTLSKTEIKLRIAAGQPVIDTEKLNLDEAALTALLERVVPILAKYSTNAASSAWTLLDAVRTGKVKLGGLVKAIVAGDTESIEKTAAELGCGAGEIVFVANVLARPVLRRLARWLDVPAAAAEISADTCPICGGAPLMASIRRDDGKRVLECSLCGTAWTAPRIRCLECGNEDEATLGFLYIEDNACRIDKCENCKAYIKTLDEKQTPEGSTAILSLEDVATLYLDMLAEGKGYHRLS